MIAPSAEPRSTVFHSWRSLPNDGISVPRAGVCTLRPAPLSRPRSTSASPNSPTVSGTSSIPDCSAVVPKSKRETSVTTSKPTIPQSSPSPPLRMPRNVEPGVEYASIVRPKTVAIANSGLRNCIAALATMGATSMRMISPTMPPIVEENSDRVRASLASPLRVIA